LISLAALGACTSDDSTTDLNTAGPPMIRQVFVQERLGTGNAIETGLAFGDHALIKPENDDRMVTRAVTSGSQEIRVVFDELLRGNPIEEILCADGLTFSRIPEGADPDDIARCSGEGAELSRCEGEHAVCLNASGEPMGIFDSNNDGAADFFRMIDYSGANCDDPTIDNPIDPDTLMPVSEGTSRNLAARLTCDGVDIPILCEDSYYNPSGTQLLPTVGTPFERSRRLGPAMVLRPRGLRTNATCQLSFREEVVDKDGERVCAPPNGDIAEACADGDTSLVAFTSEVLAQTSSSPAANATNVALRSANSIDASVRVDFNAELDALTLDAITLEANAVDVAVTRSKSTGTGQSATLTVAGGFAADTIYTVLAGTGLQDFYGGALPTATVLFSFTTRALALSSSTPANAATNVALTNSGADFVVRLNFNTTLDAGTVAANITMQNGGGAVAITTAIAGNDPGAVLVTVTGGLVVAETYTVTIATGLTDFAGNALPAQATVTFTTVPALK
jgi:hypothetical protein